MIDAKTVITKGAVEHAVGQAKDAAETAFEDLSERLKDYEALQQLRRKARNELKKAVKQVKKAELKKAVKQVKKAKTSRKARRGPRPIFLLVTVGFVAFAVYMVHRRRNGSSTYTAPDPFGEAVEEERRAQAFGQKPFATPGA
jgi:hypothetical protein